MVLIFRRAAGGLSRPFLCCCSKHNSSKTTAGESILYLDCLAGERRRRHGYSPGKGNVCVHLSHPSSSQNKHRDSDGLLNALQRMVLVSCQHECRSPSYHHSRRNNPHSPLFTRKNGPLPCTVHLGRSYLHELHSSASSPSYRQARNRPWNVDQISSPSRSPYRYSKHTREHETSREGDEKTTASDSSCDSKGDHLLHHSSTHSHDRQQGHHHHPAPEDFRSEPTSVIVWKQPAGGGSLVMYGRDNKTSFDEIFFPLWSHFAGSSQRSKCGRPDNSSTSRGSFSSRFFGGSYHHLLNYSYLEMMLVAALGYLLFGSSFFLGTHAEGGHEIDLKSFLAPGTSATASSGQGNEGKEQHQQGNESPPPFVNVTTTTTIVQPTVATAFLAAPPSPMTDQPPTSTGYTLVTTNTPPPPPPQTSSSTSTPLPTTLGPLTIFPSIIQIPQPPNPSSASPVTPEANQSEKKSSEEQPQQASSSNSSPFNYLRDRQELSKALRTGLATAAIGGIGGALRRLGVPSEKVDEFVKQNQQQLESSPSPPAGAGASSSATGNKPTPPSTPDHPVGASVTTSTSATTTTTPSPSNGSEKEDRKLRPQPYPVPVPYPVMYPAFPPAYATPVAAVAPAYVGVPTAAMRITVPPAYPLSPLAAGPTAPQAVVMTAAPVVLQQQPPAVVATVVAPPQQPVVVTPQATPAIPVMVQQPLVAVAGAAPAVASTTTTTVISPGGGRR